MKTIGEPQNTTSVRGSSRPRANTGPSQAARFLDGLDRRQIAWINLHHVTEDGLDDATTHVVNRYNRFVMIRACESGKHVSADGTKWDLPDLLRVGISIAAGRITPSTILRKLGTYRRKNHLYQDF